MKKNIVFLLVALVAVAVVLLFTKQTDSQTPAPEALPTNGMIDSTTDASQPTTETTAPAVDPAAAATETTPAVAPAADATTTVPADAANAPATTPYPTADGMPAPITAPATPVDTGGVPVTPSEGQ